MRIPHFRPAPVLLLALTLGLLTGPALAHGTAPALPPAILSEEAIFNIRGGFVCFVLFLGGVAGVAAMFTRRTISGLLFTCACALLAVDPIAEFFFFRVLLDQGRIEYRTLAITYCILSAATVALGVLCLVGAFFTAGRKAPSTGFPVQPPNR
jgi:hypothetical protein